MAPGGEHGSYGTTQRCGLSSVAAARAAAADAVARRQPGAGGNAARAGSELPSAFRPWAAQRRNHLCSSPGLHRTMIAADLALGQTAVSPLYVAPTPMLVRAVDCTTVIRKHVFFYDYHCSVSGQLRLQA